VSLEVLQNGVMTQEYGWLSSTHTDATSHPLAAWQTLGELEQIGVPVGLTVHTVLLHLDVGHADVNVQFPVTGSHDAVSQTLVG